MGVGSWLARIRDRIVSLFMALVSSCRASGEGDEMNSVVEVEAVAEAEADTDTDTGTGTVGAAKPLVVAAVTAAAAVSS